MNTSNYWISLLFFFLFFDLAYAKGDIDRQASIAANAFIEGVKISELQEGKQMLAKTSWESIRKLPDLINCENLHESMFQTDIPGILGYKQLLRVKIQSKAGTELTKKYILIAYKDRLSGIWRVFEFRESIDTSYEAQAAKADLGDTRHIKDQFNYRRYAYWLLMDGKVNAAKSALLKSYELNKSSPDPGYTRNEFDEFMGIINRIIGTGH